MKLHLPKGLRTALLAVFALTSVSYAADATYDYLIKSTKTTYHEAYTTIGVPFVDGTMVDMSQSWRLTIDAYDMWGEPCHDDAKYTGGFSIFANNAFAFYSVDDMRSGGFSSSMYKYMNDGGFSIYMTPNGSIYYVTNSKQECFFMGADPQGFATQSEGMTHLTIDVVWEVNAEGTAGTLWYVGGSFEDGTQLKAAKFALLSDVGLTSASSMVFGTSSTSAAGRLVDVDATLTMRGSGTDPMGWQITGTADLEYLTAGGENGYLDATTGEVKTLAAGDAVRFVGDSAVIYSQKDAIYSNSTIAEVDALNGGLTRSVGFGAAEGATLTVERSALAQNVLSGVTMAGTEKCGLRVVGPGTVKLAGMKVGDTIHQVSIESGSTLALASTGNVEVNLTRGVVGSGAKVTHSGSGDLTVNLDAEKSVALASLTNETTGTLNVGAVAGQGSLAAAVIDSKGAVTINAATTAAELSSTGNLKVSGSLTAAKTTVGGNLTVDAGATMTATQSLDITGDAEISGALSASGLSIKADGVTVTGSTGSLSAKEINAASVTAASGVTISQSPVSTLSSTESTALLSGNVVINKNGIVAGSIASGTSIVIDTTSEASVSAGKMENVTIQVGAGTEVTGATSTSAVTMSADGISVAGAMSADEVRIAADSSYKIQAAELTANEITVGETEIESSGSTVTLTGVKTLSATEIDAAKVEADTIKIAESFTVKNAILDAETTIGANVSLQNVSFAGALITNGNFSHNGTTFNGGGGYSDTAGAYAYAVGSEINSVELTGEQVGTTLNLDHLVIDAEGKGLDSAVGKTLAVLTANTGDIVQTDDYSESLIIDPYVVAEVKFETSVNGNLRAISGVKQITITGYNDEEAIKESLMNSSNRTAAMEAINQVEDTVDAGSPMKVLRDNLGHIYRASQQEREQLLSAISGASTTVLADSQRRGLRDVQHNLRNRIIQMGGGTTDGLLTDWQYAGIQAWAQADAAFSTTDGSGDDCGYDFNTTGATVGANLDLTANLVVGMSFSASYGEIEVDGADSASGNNDTCYLSFFARHQSNRWVQMLILTAGLNQMDLERHVGGFQAEGETEGSSLSAYYEVGYTCALDYEYNHIIQPLVSISFTSAKVDGYKESGSIGNAGLDYDSAEFFYGQVGIGARYQGVLYETVHERCAVIEARAMVTQDFGDTTDEATVGLIAGGSSYKVTGVDSTGTGFQLGVGLSIPVEQHTTVFADADITCAPDYTGVRANIGLRYDF